MVFQLLAAMINPKQFRLLHAVELKYTDKWYLQHLINEYGNKNISVADAIYDDQYSAYICP